MAQRFFQLAEWWHLLSLDAPTVAALWSWLFVYAMHLHLSVVQAFLLPAGTWVLYVADRILDGMRQGERLRERHHFHIRYRWTFIPAASVLAVLLVWPVATRMRPEALRDDTLIGAFALLYLLAVHALSARCLPKEAAVAILFAAATAVPAWSRLRAGRGQLAPAILFFALLCWTNCVGIEKWEGGSPHVFTRWASLHLRSIVTVVAILSLAGAWLAPSRGLRAVYLASLLSSALLFALDVCSTHLSPLRLRIAADAALLTPLALFPFVR